MITFVKNRELRSFERTSLEGCLSVRAGLPAEVTARGLAGLPADLSTEALA
jgi:hypothetical protein